MLSLFLLLPFELEKERRENFTLPGSLSVSKPPVILLSRYSIWNPFWTSLSSLILSWHSVCKNCNFSPVNVSPKQPGNTTTRKSYCCPTGCRCHKLTHLELPGDEKKKAGEKSDEMPKLESEALFGIHICNCNSSSNQQQQKWSKTKSFCV